MLSLAPIRYAKVLHRDGGPIARLESAEGTLLGMPCMHAAAYLNEGLVPDSVRSHTRTAQPDGAGSHASEQIACHMAVSEALERWAVYHCRARSHAGIAGLGYDCSSNGFAAFPGLFKRQAREAAFRESIERHCLISWWEGLLGHRFLPDPQPGVRAIKIENPFSSHSVVILWEQLRDKCCFAFGAGGGNNHAIWRAFVELQRTQTLLENLGRSNAKSSLGEAVGSLFERRIWYFSTAKGMLRFLSRLEQTAGDRVAPLKLLFDDCVSGPWNRYASVWRTVIEAPSQDYLSDVDDFFFW